MNKIFFGSDPEAEVDVKILILSYPIIPVYEMFLISPSLCREITFGLVLCAKYESVDMLENWSFYYLNV